MLSLIQATAILKMSYCILGLLHACLIPKSPSAFFNELIAFLVWSEEGSWVIVDIFCDLPCT